VFKYSGSATVAPRLFVVNNTFWTNQPGVDGSGQYAGGGSNPDFWFVRNNLFRMTRYAAAFPKDRLDEDYNVFYTSDAHRGIDYGQNIITVSEYRDASGQGSHTNVSDRTDRFKTDPELIDAAHGDLWLPTGSPLIDAGVELPNIASDYHGAAPDIGATEHE
jgi:hypothetical protein